MDIYFTEQLEELLKTKKYESLNEEEEKYVLSLITKQQYCEYSEFFQQLSLSMKLEQQKLNVSGATLPKLQEAFQKKHTRKTQITYYLPIAASLIIGLFLYSILPLNNNDLEYNLTDEEFNKYTQFDYTTLYVEMDELKFDDEVTEELMNMEIVH